MLSNPLNFRVALQFAVLYALVRWLVVWADERFGNAGTYVAGALAGVTDVDAVTLSMARMANDPGWSTQAQVTILIAATVNTLVGFGIAVAVGGPVLRRNVTPGFVGMPAAGSSEQPLPPCPHALHHPHHVAAFGHLHKGTIQLRHGPATHAGHPCAARAARRVHLSDAMRTTYRVPARHGTGMPAVTPRAFASPPMCRAIPM